MKKRIPIIDALQTIQQSVVVCGWVRTIRHLKEVIFIEINDGSCLANLQLVIHSTSSVSSRVEAITIGTSIQCCGLLQKSEGKEQAVEMIPSSIMSSKESQVITSLALIK